MKKVLGIFLVFTVVLAGCQGNSKESDSQGKGSVMPTVKAEKTKEATAVPTATPTPAATATLAATITPAATATPTSSAVKNTMALMDLKNFSGVKAVKTENYEDNSYYYEDSLSDDESLSILINQSIAKSKFSAQTGEELAKECIAYIAGKDAPYDISCHKDAEYSAQFTYPSYLCSWFIGSGEDTQHAVTIIIETENFVYAYCCRTSAEMYETKKEVFNDLFQSLQLEEIE